ncbi:acetate--CoA ligase family protein [Bacteroidota bacterium]
MNSFIDKFFYPKSIAVIGASSKKGSLSWELVNNIITYGFKGKLFPVNPKSDSVHSIKAYNSITDIKDEVDMAFIMVPKHLVLQAIDECAKKKVNAVVLITAGFKEVGGEGIELENQLIEKIKKYKIRLVGPNCMGIINSSPDVRLNGTFVKVNPLYGKVGFISQSGALGAAVLRTVRQSDIRLAQFVSIGNKADISGKIVLEYWKDNDDIKVITLYLESFEDPRGFMKLAREISKTKPIIVVKSARTAAGMKAASSHTGALTGADTVVDALLEQGGVIRVNTVDEMFDLAKAFERANLPKGNRIGVLTNAGGPAILTVDESEKVGLKIPELTLSTQAKIRQYAFPEASVRNPVDLLPPATAEMWGKATHHMLSDKNIDALIVILGPPLMLDTVEIALSICKAAKKSKKTVMLVLMSQDDVFPVIREKDPGHPPIYRYPEIAARAVAEMLSYQSWQKEPIGNYVNIKVNKSAVKKVLNSQSRKGEFYLDSDDVNRILRNYKFPVVDSYFAKDVEASLEIAKKIGYPLVSKVTGKELIHKSDIGGVAVNIHDDDELISSEKKIVKNLKAKGIYSKLEGFLVQPYIRGEVETIMGVFKDVTADHLIMFGLGGTLVEVFEDVKFKLLPITDTEAESLIKSIKSYELLKGVRGNPPIDVNFVKENLLRLSQLIQDFPEFIEIDFNPFVFSADIDKCKILDARMKVKI